jgi:hypothetical protein
MSFYFKNFPTVNYDIKKNDKLQVLTNLTVRFRIQEALQNKVTVMYDYNVKEGERPDIIAHKYYKDSTLDWVILLVNNIIDPHFEWPLDSLSLDSFIREKYGSVANAQSQVHHYEKILRRQSVAFDGTVIPEKSIYVDQETYNTLSASDRKVVTNYDYEINLNEQKAIIKILDKKFITNIINAVDLVLQ